MRHLYKAAEFREDGELFGLLQQRFELGSPSCPDGNGWVMVNRKYMRYTEEVVRPDSKVAYSGTTRDYLRRRGWRTLRRLAEDGAPGFVTMAAGVLLAADDGDAGTWQIRTANDGYQRHYGPYSHWMASTACCMPGKTGAAIAAAAPGTSSPRTSRQPSASAPRRFRRSGMPVPKSCCICCGIAAAPACMRSPHAP